MTILCCPASRKFFGIHLAGWFMVYNTIPFGFKASAFIYHTTGLIPISFCRGLGVPALLYIDDQLICQWIDNGENPESSVVMALKGLYVVCQVLVRLGYFLNIQKCMVVPTQKLKFLGMWCDSQKLAFLPDDKKASFACLRDMILGERKFL